MSRLRHPFVGYLILLAAFVYWTVNQQVATYNSQVASCERGNVNREGQLELASDLVDVNEGRVIAAAGNLDYETMEANLYALRQYAQDRDTLVASQAEVATVKGGVTADCKDIYPKPGLFP